MLMEKYYIHKRINEAIKNIDKKIDANFIDKRFVLYKARPRPKKIEILINMLSKKG